MRTTDEIVRRMREIEKADFFGVMTSDLLEFLPFDVAKPHLKDEVTEQQWAEHMKPQTDEAVKDAMLAYMPFAWEKANHCRGLSAGRSIMHMQVWLWLLGRDAASEGIGEYDYYGKPQLRAICEDFGWDWTNWDDGAWRHSEDGDGDPPPASVVALATT